MLDALATCTTVALDKTGTLTTGALSCTGMSSPADSTAPSETQARHGTGVHTALPARNTYLCTYMFHSACKFLSISFLLTRMLWLVTTPILAG